MPIDVNEYAHLLYTRVEAAVMLQPAVIEGGDWQPQPNQCHENVTIWCLHNITHEPVRGWLYFSLPGTLHVRFVAHSAVRTPEGQLFDITPSNAGQDYPFITGELTEDEYAELVETGGHGQIDLEVGLHW